MINVDNEKNSAPNENIFYYSCCTYLWETKLNN